jgi:hypothetical protein
MPVREGRHRKRDGCLIVVGTIDFRGKGVWRGRVTTGSHPARLLGGFAVTRLPSQTYTPRDETSGFALECRLGQEDGTSRAHQPGVNLVNASPIADLVSWSFSAYRTVLLSDRCTGATGMVVVVLVAWIFLAFFRVLAFFLISLLLSHRGRPPAGATLSEALCVPSGTGRTRKAMWL